MYLVRHGETPANLERRYAGASSEPLTRRGREEVEALALRLDGLDIRAIWTSEVVRARETAHLLGKALRAPVVTDPRLNEMRMGPWEGLTEEEVARRFPNEWNTWRSMPDRLKLDGRETLDALADRVEAVVADAFAAVATVLIVSHVAPIRVATLKALGLPLAQYRRLRVANAECFKVVDHAGDVRRLGSERSLRTELASAEEHGSAA